MEPYDAARTRMYQRDAHQHGTIIHIGQRHTTNNIQVGHWVTTQRPKHRQDRVTPKRTTTLQASLGWNWAPRTPR